MNNDYDNDEKGMMTNCTANQPTNDAHVRLYIKVGPSVGGQFQVELHNVDTNVQEQVVNSCIFVSTRAYPSRRNEELLILRSSLVNE